MYIVAGVTCSGKSTFLRSNAADALDLTNKQVIFAHEVGFSRLIGKKSRAFSPKGDVLHYNLMRPAVHMESGARDYYDFHSDPAFSFIEKNARRLTAIVVIAAEAAIYRRLNDRVEIEPGRPRRSDDRYPRQYWRELLEANNIGEIYERFALEMERLSIPCRFYMSTDDPDEPFKEVHRYSAKSILNRGYAPPLGNIRSYKENDFEYQRINLTHEHNTRGQNRTASLLDALALELQDKTVLDVGSAIGGLAFSAEQMGARRVVGLEPKSNRLEASVEIKRVINSQCEFWNETVSSLGKGVSFDHVFALNVAHHMPDFLDNLRILSSITNETLTLEFPGLSDPKYRGSFIGRVGSCSPRMPVVGVSVRSKDQTFVFSPEALRRILLDHGNDFGSYTVWLSPMRHRYFMRFYKEVSAGSHRPVRKVKRSQYPRTPRSASGSRVVELLKETKFIRDLWHRLRRAG